MAIHIHGFVGGVLSTLVGHALDFRGRLREAPDEVAWDVIQTCDSAYNSPMHAIHNITMGVFIFMLF
jgi:hypothetical protein